MGQSLALSQKVDKHVERWDVAMESIIADNLQEISAEDYLTERSMRKVVNL